MVKAMVHVSSQGAKMGTWKTERFLWYDLK